MAELQVTEKNFKTEVLESPLPVLVDFWAPWCGPCRMLAPVISEIAEEYADTIKICKVNVDEAGELAAQFGIVSIPTVIVFRNGQVSDKSVGFRSKEQLVSLLGL